MNAKVFVMRLINLRCVIAEILIYVKLKSLIFIHK